MLTFERWIFEMNYLKDPQFNCIDCKDNIFALKEYPYILRDETWDEAGKPKGMLCIGCAELRLGRKLTAGDFDPTNQLNSPKHDVRRSERLKDRMKN